MGIAEGSTRSQEVERHDSGEGGSTTIYGSRYFFRATM